ncbi:toprim domain-containing protein [Bacillus sp. FJAT-44742]|uniref:toprim domain-containing protein n=1 Tax=Bacillus sp. FJAT-44742 TaxID=2014005 RepID=UPI001E4F8718|nr:toprim domain-containing protein [Bacillus sp. FJAT-44742]
MTTDEINQAKEVRIIDLMEANGIQATQEGQHSEPYYRLTDHDSFVIKGEKFFWNSQQEGGYGAISFAMIYYDLKFPDAVKRINEHEYAPVKSRGAAVKHEPFKYPHYYEVKKTDKVRDYLIQERKIDHRVVDWCLEKDLIAQDKKDNAVFKWKNNHGTVVGADRQGTQPMKDKESYFKGMVAKSLEDGGFTIDVGKNPNKVAVFESPIDMLSYWSMKKERVRDTRMVSMGGLKIESLKRAIKDAGEKGYKIEKVISAVDNDKAGNQFHEKLDSLLKEEVLVDHRPTAKDWNDERKNSLSSSKRTKQKNAQMGM